ncbi:cystathionine gamma-synthase [Candidatus Dependentiae bacterium]
MSKKENKFGTIAIRAGQNPDPSTGAIMTPIYLTSTYVQKEPGETFAGYEYSRSENPTRTALEKNLAALEKGNYGICFASGCSAVVAVLHLLEKGAHVILGDDVYSGTFRILDKIFSQVGITYSTVDLANPDEINKAITEKTKLVLLETPTNPLLKITDIKNIASLIKKKNPQILLAVDNTFATPYLQNPLSLGADIVCHSSTKYIGGHSDIIGGAIVVNNEKLAHDLYFIQKAVGAVPSPMDCFLLLRSTKTLHVRMDRHCENAKKIANFLDQHPNIKNVFYPGLASHPQHSIAKNQMQDFGGMISFVIKGDQEHMLNFCRKTKLFTLAESLGGVESLIEIPSIMTHVSLPVEKRIAMGITDNLVRLSAGIEDVDDLIDDLKMALDHTK